MFASMQNLFRGFFPRHRPTQRLSIDSESRRLAPLLPIGFGDFLKLEVPPREMLLHPILPERSLAMLYAPRGMGKSLLAHSIGLAVASGSPLLRWSAPRNRRVILVDGEMPIISLKERLISLSAGFGSEI